MSVGRRMAVGWVLLAAGGWAATLWLGEPSATAGPGPAPAVGVRDDNPEPGPQPEGSCATPRATPSPSESADPLSAAKVPEEYRDEYVVQVLCDYSVAR